MNSTSPRWPQAHKSRIIGDKRDLILFADTFNRYVEPENLTAARRVLRAFGYRLHRALRQWRLNLRFR